MNTVQEIPTVAHERGPGRRFGFAAAAFALGDVASKRGSLSLESTGALLDAGTRVLNLALRDAPTRGGRARVVRDDAGGSYLSVTFPGPAGHSLFRPRRAPRRADISL